MSKKIDYTMFRDDCRWNFKEKLLKTLEKKPENIKECILKVIPILSSDGEHADILRLLLDFYQKNFLEDPDSEELLKETVQYVFESNDELTPEIDKILEPYSHEFIYEGDIDTSENKRLSAEIKADVRSALGEDSEV